METTTAEQIFQWIESRKRPGIQPVFPCSGYGPNGAYTLFLPPYKSERTLKFRNGKPSIETIRATTDTQELNELRRKIIGCFTPIPGTGNVFEFDESIIEFSAAVLQFNYNLSDDDLSFLHVLGGPWIKRIAVYVSSGDETVKLFSNIDSASLQKWFNFGSFIDRVPDPPAATVYHNELPELTEEKKPKRRSRKRK